MTRFSKMAKSALSVALAGAMVLSGTALIPEFDIETQAADLCTVDISKTYQTIRGFGGINLREWTGSDLTDAQVQKAFGNGNDELGLSILRVYVNDDSNAWNQAVPVAKKAQALGATVFATPWNPPASIRINGDGSLTGGKYQLRKDKWAEYANHLNGFAKYMEGQGVKLYSISVQNEPDYAEDWTYWNPNDLASFIAQYGKNVTAGTNVKLMSPESFQYRKDIYTPILNNPQAMANCDLFGTHFYGTQRSGMDFPALENSGKEIWMTEVYVPNSSSDADTYPEAVEVAQNIHNGLVVGNLNAYVWWYIRRSYGLIKENGNISKRGYCMAQYSKFVRPGDVRVEVTEQPAKDVYVSAYKNSKNQVSIVAVNMSNDGYAQQFSMGNNKIGNVDRWRTSANENLAKTENLEVTNGSTFWAQLPAKSVSTFVVTMDGGVVPTDPTPTEPVADENGYFFHDTFENGIGDWTGHGGTEVSLSGRNPYEGKDALIVQGRTSAWMGMEKKLPSSFIAGKTYSFSVNVCEMDGADTDTYYFKLNYTDASGKAHYVTIADGTAPNGQWVQLSNEHFTIPEDAIDPIIYVETADSTTNFYIDDVVGAVEGTKVDGAGTPVIKTVLRGDLNGDGVVNVIDYALAKRGLLKGFGDTYVQKSADVNQSGTVDVSDLVTIQKFITKKINKFDAVGTQTPTVTEPVTTTVKSMQEFTAECASKVAEYDTADSRVEKDGTQYGTIKSGTYYSTTCKREKPYNILLPAGYDSSKKYPVLYVMHGYWENQNRMITEGNGTMYTRQIIGNAIAEGEAKDMIVVFPYIYSSDSQDACSGMDDFNNAAYDNFINDLTKDLMPHIESTYSVKTGKDNTAITGFSMGGREALLIGMQRSDLFGYVGAMCPAPGVTGAFKWNSGKEPYLLMITGGSNDTVVYNNPETYHNNFTQNGVPHIWHYVNGGYHGDNSIHAHLYNFCRFVFKATD